MTLDETYMHRCIELAQQGLGYAAPNPIVGSVLVYSNSIIGEGFHEKFGEAHAEVNCIANAEKHLAHLNKSELEKVFTESTLYVSLEPCSHYGKTPPCADLIIQKKIGRVVVAMQDPFAKVNGNGIDKLREAGIDVNVGTLESIALEYNKRFICFNKYHRPYVILKWAQSANGYLSKKGNSKFPISNTYTNRLVHKWRSEEASIMVGTNTAELDNPLLTTRLWPGNNPMRVLIDKNCRIDAANNILNDSANTIVFNSLKTIKLSNVEYVQIVSAAFLENVLAILAEMSIQSVIVEGGSKLLQSFIDENLWDEARIITNNSLMINDGITSPILQNAREINVVKLKNDTIQFYKNAKPSISFNLV